MQEKTLTVSQLKPWMKYYSSDVQAHQMPRKTVYSHLKDVNKGHLLNAAVNYYGNRISYGELIDMADKSANAFAALGVKQGDIVSFLSVAVPECIAAIYGLNKIGATANTIDPRMDVDSIRRMVRESTSEILVVIDVAFPKVEKIMQDIDQKKIIVQSATRSLPFIKKMAMKIMSKTKIKYTNTVITWDKFIEGGKGTEATEAPYDGDATVVIAYTGGTTGFPKGVMLTNDGMNAVAHNFRYAGLAAKPGDTFLGIIPVFTSYGVVCGMHMPLTMGFELIPIPKFVPAELGKLVRDFKPNHMISTPAFYEMMMLSEEVKDLDLSFLITMGSGGDTMNEGLEAKLHAFMKRHNIKYPLAQGYGMSEVSAAASFCVNAIYKPASVGIPSVTTTIGIFDPETGEELGFNEMGEICITGPSMMKGYYLRPEETADTKRLHADGQYWIHSGDVGYIDEDGFVFIKGRVKRMIVRFDGHKVFPVNMESIVSKYEFVRNCCVVPVDDMEHGQGQYPLIVVELHDAVDAAYRTRVCKTIYERTLAELEERGQPVAILAVDAIPLTGSGKNDFKALEVEYSKFDYLTWQESLKTVR